MAEEKPMPVVILAGGLATRLRPLTTAVPKAMLAVHGRPFLLYQLELLRAAGLRQIVLCTGHLGEQIVEYFGDGRKFGVSLAYSRDGQQLLGTGGALRKATPLLGEEFLVMYGDAYLMSDYAAIQRAFRACRQPGLMVVYRNKDQYDRSNVVLGDGRVTFYSKTEQRPGMVYIDAGVSIFRKSVVELIPPGSLASLESLHQLLIARGQLAAFETEQRFYEIGSLSGLKEFEHFVAGQSRLAVGATER